MQESVVKSDLSPEEVLKSLQNGLVKIGFDNSVRGEIQYFLYLKNHYDGMYDFSRNVFVGSVPGAEIVEELISGLYTGRLSDESVDLLMVIVNGNPEFVSLLQEDLS